MEMLAILGYSAIGFGLGGITFRNHKKKEISREFNKFKVESENEIDQKDRSKNNYMIKTQETIKDNTELKKQNNRSLRNIELLQEQLAMALQKIEYLTSGEIKKTEEKVVKKEVKKEVKAKSNAKGATK